MFGKDVAIENARLEVRVEMLDKQLETVVAENRELKAMLSRAQEALVAKESPEAYRDHKNAEYEASMVPMTDEEKAEAVANRRRAETNANYIAEIERPLFRDADDLIQMLTRPEGTPSPVSLHNNGES